MVLKKRQTSKVVNPDEVVFVGQKYAEELSIQLFEYDEHNIQENQNLVLENLPESDSFKNNFWLNVHGIHDIHSVRKICAKYGIHRLIIRDIIDTNQRPKIQEFDDHLFFTVKSILPKDKALLEPEQISFVLSKNGLISFQEKKGDHFSHIRERLRKKLGLVRSKPIDFLLFLLLEAIIHNYYESVDFIEEEVSKMMDNSKTWNSNLTIIHSIEKHRKDLYKLHKLIKPLKEALSVIDKQENSFIRKEQRSYFYDLKEQTLDLSETIEALRYRLESAVNLYFSMQGHKMNQIMKTLTIVATTFIPLTFIVGVYGMNFEFMPELQYKWGYFVVWGIMLAIVLGMVIFFRWKKWD